MQNLKTLQLQGNYICDLEEVKNLNQLYQLQSLTLNGNPLEEIKGYRLYVLGIMFGFGDPAQMRALMKGIAPMSQLKKLDTVIISNSEYDNAIVWNSRLYQGMH